jgi:hypothetical protein
MGCSFLTKLLSYKTQKKNAFHDFNGIFSSSKLREKKLCIDLGGIAKLVKCWTTGQKILGSILAQTRKGVQHERLKVSPCEIIRIY